MAIYGVRSRPSAQTAYYQSGDAFTAGDYIVVDTGQDMRVGKICAGPMETIKNEASQDDLPVIVRRATDEDLENYKQNLANSKDAFTFCKQKIKERALEMKLVDVEIFSDNSKYIFFFTAPNRIDFRELVKDLVAKYRARIELRQIGVRHEAQMLGALGNCGQICCCKRYLRKFAPAVIKMAKEQNLFLNPVKISGICGRLLCCLSYEQECYENFQQTSPRPGKKYSTDKGILKIARTNMFKNSITALTEKNEELEFSLDDWNKLHPKNQGSDPTFKEEAPPWTKISDEEIDKF